MRNVLGLLTVLAVSIQHADSHSAVYLNGRSDFKVTRKDGPHPTIQIEWETYFLCRVKEIVLLDPLNRERSIIEPKRPCLVESTDAFPIVHWVEYIAFFKYDCPCGITWQRIKMRTWSGEPMPLRTVKVFTTSNSATVEWEVPPEVLHSSDRASVVAKLFREENYHSQPRDIDIDLMGPLKLTGLSPGAVYTAVVAVKIANYKSKEVEAKFIVDAPGEYTQLKDISVVSRTETSVTLGWGGTEKENLSQFIVGYVVRWRSSQRGSTWHRAAIKNQKFTIGNLSRRTKYNVTISACLRCGNRIVRGATNEAIIEAEDDFQGAWRLLLAGAVLTLLALILILTIVLLCLRVRSKLRERKLMERAKFLERTSCFSNTPSLTGRVRFIESQNSSGPSSSNAGRF